MNIKGVILKAIIIVTLLSSCSKSLNSLSKDEINHYIANNEVTGETFDFGVVSRDKIFTINFCSDITKVPNEEFIVSVHTDSTGSKESLVNYETNIEKTNEGYLLSIKPPIVTSSEGFEESYWGVDEDLYIIIWYSLIDSELIKYEKPIVVPFKVREVGERLK